MANVTVADFDGGLDWYKRFFGRPADRHPMDGLAKWQLTRTGVVARVASIRDPEGNTITLRRSSKEISLAAP